MNLNFDNHVTVVFGAASGIGRAIATAFVGEKGRVVLVDRDPQVVEVANSLEIESASHAIAHVVDVTDFEKVQSLAKSIVETLGPPRHIVFAVGAGSGKSGFPFWNLTPQDWPRVLEVNLLAAVNVAHAFAPGLSMERQGTMLFLSSVAGQIGSQTDPPYSASKAALINFAQVAAKDLAPYGVRVNVISPGMVQTPLNRAVWQAWNAQQTSDAQKTYDDWASEKIAKITPLGRWQSPDDIASLALFLASDRARDITGQTLNVDGGQVMHS